MPIEVSVQCADVTNVPADLLLLKHAQGFYGADESVATRLTQRGLCSVSDISPADGEHRLVDSSGAIAAKKILFLGTADLREFRYREMKQFAQRAIEVVGAARLTVQTLTTTVHGAAYGLDVAESLRALIFGFQQGLATSPLPQLQRIVFVELNSRRCEL